MKKVILNLILVILFIGSIICVANAFSKYQEYKNTKESRTNIKEIENKIEEVEKEIEDSKEEIEKIKEEQKDKIKLVEEWKAKIEKIKSYM